MLAALRATIDERPDDIAVRAFDPDGAMEVLTYRRLHDAAAAVGEALSRLGIGRGDRILMALPTCGEFFAVYLGCLASGIIPAVVPGPRAGQAGFDADYLGTVAAKLAARCIVVRDAVAAAAVPGDTLSAALPPVVAAKSLLDADRPAYGVDSAVADPDGIAHLQGTSGSTAMPRWAIVRHRNIAANVRAIGTAILQRDDDVLVTWLPMSHDMGLIGVSYAWYWGIPIVAADPSNFIRNPLFWLDLIGRFGGTLSPAPNSAYQACCRIARLRPPAGLNLSSWRVALCGAEPVHEATLREFAQTFGRFGLRREALMPVYGLAEATLAVTISSPTEPFHAERVNAASCAPGVEVATVAEDDRRSVVPMVACGRVIEGHELRIAAADGNPVAEGIVGEIEVRGDSVIDGYWAAAGAADDSGLKRNGFLRTGDLGYLRDGEIFVTGRMKEILIIGGRNFSPLQIEATLERILAVPFTPAVVAVEAVDEHLNSGALHLLLDSRLRAGAQERNVEARIRQTLEQVFGLRGATLHWVASGHIPRTTSGKIQRFRCRELITQKPERATATMPPASRQTVSAAR